jgi:hypothetical protein
VHLAGVEEMKEEALKLADWLDKSIDTDDWGELAKYYQWCHENVSPMIRRLVEELDKQKETIRKLNKTLGFINSGYEVINLEPQTKPLSDEEILNSWVEIDLPEECWITDEHLINFAKAIEERHGIK